MRRFYDTVKRESLANYLQQNLCPYIHKESGDPTERENGAHSGGWRVKVRECVYINVLFVPFLIQMISEKYLDQLPTFHPLTIHVATTSGHTIYTPNYRHNHHHITTASYSRHPRRH